MIEIVSFSSLADRGRADFAAAGFNLAAAPSDRDHRKSPVAGIVRAIMTSGVNRVTADDMDAFPNIEIICTLGAGYDHIDIAAARSRGIVVANGPGANADSVADHAMALLLAAVRGIADCDRQIRAGTDWAAIRSLRPALSGKRLGILGLGRIGAKIAARGAGGFGMEIGYHNRTPVAGSPYRYFESASALAEWARFLAVTLPGGAQSRHLVDAGVLAALGPDGFIVNVGRGDTIALDDLTKALTAGVIAGAGLDVFEGEPTLPEALRALPNVTFTPHIAGQSPDSVDVMVRLAIDNLKAHFSGQPLLTPIPGF